MPAQDWSRIVNTTIHDYVREQEINILRNRKLLAMLEKRGRITFGHSGDLTDWKVKYKRPPIQGYADSDTLTFSRKDRWKTAQLDWRGYASTDSMTKKEKLQNAGTEAIIKVYSEMAANMLDDMADEFGDEFYIDGNAAGNGKRMHGIESVFAGATSSAGNLVGTNAATYAGLNTTLAAYGGNWSGTWPVGTGDAHYDFWTPLVVDYTNTGWTASTKTWQNTCQEALRFMIIKSKKNKGKKGQLDLTLLTDDLYRLFMNALDSEVRLMINRNQAKGGLYELGYGDVVNFEGVEVTYEYGVPANLGYGWSLENVELRSMQEQLFVPVGPDFDIATQSYRFSLDMFGNLIINPRFQGKLINLS